MWTGFLVHAQCCATHLFGGEFRHGPNARFGTQSLPEIGIAHKPSERIAQRSHVPWSHNEPGALVLIDPRHPCRQVCAHNRSTAEHRLELDKTKRFLAGR
jgi:hypothetical protein